MAQRKFKMRIESMIKRTFATMLVGAVAGIASSASAGVLTWMASGSYANGDIYGGTDLDNPFANFNTEGAASWTAQSISGFGVTLYSTGIVNNASVGIGGSATGGTGVAQAQINISQNFVVSGGAVSVSLNFAMSDSAYAMAQLSKFNPNGAPGNEWDLIAGFDDNTGGAQSFAWSGSLTDGTYAVYLLADTGDLAVDNGQWASFSVVPAPGAVALVGLAGLAGGRRRRA
jgi:MYXO-CTERM domain-containing protein